MTVAKKIKSEGVAIFFETNEQLQLPEAVRKAVSGFSSFPYVVFADPSGTKVYGAFEHKMLKSQDYGKIFRDVKKVIRTAIQDGSLLEIKPGNAKPAAEAEAVTVKSPNDNSDEDMSDDLLGRKVIKGTEMETWTSSKGSEIEGRLVGVEPGEVYIIELENGREVKVTAKQLSPDSLLRLEELVAGE